MRRLELIPEHDSLMECIFCDAPQQVSVFLRKVIDGKFFPQNTLSGELAYISADNYNDSNFERAFMWFDTRCPSWPEMVQLKDFLWCPQEIVFQVHPRKEEYVNIKKTALHLWKAKDFMSQKTLRSTRSLVFKTLSLLQQERDCTELSFKEDIILGKRFVAILGGKDWPTWDEVCTIKKHCFGEDSTALQFNICKEIDLNQKHILILWDATDFNIKLPPKELV